jgi:hypothetical protein
VINMYKFFKRIRKQKEENEYLKKRQTEELDEIDANINRLNRAMDAVTNVNQTHISDGGEFISYLDLELKSKLFEKVGKQILTCLPKDIIRISHYGITGLKLLDKVIKIREPYLESFGCLKNDIIYDLPSITR